MNAKPKPTIVDAQFHAVVPHVRCGRRADAVPLRLRDWTEAIAAPQWLRDRMEAIESMKRKREAAARAESALIGGLGLLRALCERLVEEERIMSIAIGVREMPNPVTDHITELEAALRATGCGDKWLNHLRDRHKLPHLPDGMDSTWDGSSINRDQIRRYIRLYTRDLEFAIFWSAQPDPANQIRSIARGTFK